MSIEPGKRIAVVGGGVAGIVSAYLLSKNHSVTLFERNQYLGGHTNTVVLDKGPDAGTPVDTGFIVLNNQTYPLLHRFLNALNVPWRWSNMSFGYHCKTTDLEYAGTGLSGLFSDRKNIIRPGFYRFLWDVARFSRRAKAALAAGELADVSVGDFLERERISEAVRDHYLIPMSGAIWSAPQQSVLDFPAETLVRFFQNHGLLQIINMPRWQTVVGGSHSYVHAFKRVFPGELLLNTGVERIRRSSESVTVVDSQGNEAVFDYVVSALHADLVLPRLESPTDEERALLGVWKYENNETVLHWDESVLPSNRRTWASWNYIRDDRSNSNRPVRVTYHMNRLQGLTTEREYCVTLNATDAIDPEKIVRVFNYSHPSYTFESIRSQKKLALLQGTQRSYFCGSYFGFGFHEDAVRSAVAVGKHFGVEL